MIFSKGVLAFLKDNKPAEEKFSMPEKVLGVVKTEEEEQIVFTYGLVEGYHELYLDPSREIEIEWSVRVNIDDPTKVVYEPSVVGTGGHEIFSGDVKSAKKCLLEHFNIKTQEVAFPEIVIQLPIPEWVGEEYFGQGDCPNTDVASKVCFVSEAKQMISEFKEKLGEIENDLEKLPVKEVKEIGKKFSVKDGIPYCKKCGEKIKLTEEFDEIQQCWIMRISCGESCVKFYQDYHESDISEGGLLSYLKNSGYFKEV